MNVMKRRGFFALLAIPLNTGEGQDNLGGVQFLWDQGKERLFSKLQQLKFYFKYTHNQLPSYFNNNSKTNKSTNYKSFEIKMSSNVHSHNTHYKSNLHSENKKNINLLKNIWDTTLLKQLTKPPPLPPPISFR